MNGPLRTLGVHFEQEMAQQVLVEEGNRVEGLVLSTGCHLTLEGELARQAFGLFLVRRPGKCAVQRDNVPTRLLDVGAFGGQRLVLATQSMASHQKGAAR